VAIELWIAGAFFISGGITAVTRTAPEVSGCLLPILAAVAPVIYLEFFIAHIPANSTAPVIVPFGFFWTAVGSVPGAFAGAWLRRALNRKKSGSSG
jgi:hypothetical protein